MHLTLPGLAVSICVGVIFKGGYGKVYSSV